MALLWLPLPATRAQAADLMVLTDRLHHLRQDGPREWSTFPERPEAASLEVKFSVQANAAEQTLVLRQQDVKQAWSVRLNDVELGRLVVDENDMVLAWAVPASTLRDGENVLRIQQLGEKPKIDDIRVGEFRIVPQSRADYLGQAKVRVTVQDGKSGKPLPSRITVIQESGALQTVDAASGGPLAVRPGVIYTATGEAEFGLPAGKYTVFAGRGFEYSLTQTSFEIGEGDNLERTLKIEREVPTEGYVACDTHVHTLTYSGHGDATIAERMITLAGEGIELPIATDHNRHVDYEPFARELGVRRYFTPVMGNEVTTSLGHFNVFPASANAAPPDYRAVDWTTIFQDIYRTPDVKVVILNHARDLHSGVRPFGPALHNAASGANVAGWKLRANAMEVVNSGATQTDPLQLVRDWMAALNHGQILTPIGGSDSHDVARHFVGQARTYIRADDGDPAAIGVDYAVASLVAGRVMVSYGLLAELTVGDRYGPGELAPLADDEVAVRVRVLGPHWSKANRLMLFANGELVREAAIEPGQRTEMPGVIADVSWKLPRPTQDVHLVAVALGPGISGLYWPTAKPYQPTSPEFTPVTLGCSGAVWLDGDEDGRKTPAIDYARQAVAVSGGDLRMLLVELAKYDAATAIQAADLWQQSGRNVLDPDVSKTLQDAAPHVRDGFGRFATAWRENQLNRP